MSPEGRREAKRREGSGVPESLLLDFPSSWVVAQFELSHYLFLWPVDTAKSLLYLLDRCRSTAITVTIIITGPLRRRTAMA
jgi:hypothetical protein